MSYSSNTFTGEYTYTVDPKSRVNIPAKFRQALSPENDNSFAITKGMDQCIWVYPLVEWNKVLTKLREQSSSQVNRAFTREYSRFASTVSYDKQGRILLSTELIDYAKIDRQVTIIGLINKIEIWNPSLLKNFDQQVLSQNKEAFDELAEKIIL